MVGSQHENQEAISKCQRLLNKIFINLILNMRNTSVNMTPHLNIIIYMKKHSTATYVVIFGSVWCCWLGNGWENDRCQGVEAIVRKMTLDSRVTT